MAPNQQIMTDEKREEHGYERIVDPKNDPKTAAVKDYKLKKMNILFVAGFHLFALYGLLTKLTTVKWETAAWSLFMVYFSGIGISAGIHRYWSHRSFKAALPLKVLLTFCYNTAGQVRIIQWVRDHRVHHKFSETEADPHDVRRGFFFAHFGWFFCEKNAQVAEKGRQLDLSDITNCPVASFHDKHFEILRLVFCYTLPTLVPIYFWGEDPWTAFQANCLRYVWLLNTTWSINSFAHNHGTRPYDQKLRPSENKLVSFFAFGEGWHNYHHVFPYDYRSSELLHMFNFTKFFIETMAKIGWAYDLRVASPEMVHRRIKRTGDGTHPNWGTVAGMPIPADPDHLGY